MVAKKQKAGAESKSRLAQGVNFHIFVVLKMVAIAQLVRASDCGSEGRGFEPHWLPGV